MGDQPARVQKACPLAGSARVGVSANGTSWASSPHSELGNDMWDDLEKISPLRVRRFDEACCQLRVQSGEVLFAGLPVQIGKLFVHPRGIGMTAEDRLQFVDGVLRTSHVFTDANGTRTLLTKPVATLRVISSRPRRNANPFRGNLESLVRLVASRWPRVSDLDDKSFS